MLEVEDKLLEKILLQPLDVESALLKHRSLNEKFISWKLILCVPDIDEEDVFGLETAQLVKFAQRKFTGRVTRFSLLCQQILQIW